MKRFFIILSCFVVYSLGAQSITLTYNNTVLESGAQIDVTSPQGVSSNTYIELSNHTSTDVFFRVQKEILTGLDASLVTFCVGGTCYTGNTSMELMLATGVSWGLEDEENVFHSTFTHDVPGTHAVRYTFTNSDDPNDVATVVINYYTPTGVRDNVGNNMLTAYPNPATTSVTVEYPVPDNATARLVVKNLTGMTVCSAHVNASGKSVLDLSSLTAGIYFYGVECDGKMLCTKKLLVK